MPQDPQHQLELFREAYRALGGEAATARYLNVNPRHVRRLYGGNSPLHDGLLEDLGRGLLEHADHCRQLERRISPAFKSNLTARQLERPPHGNAGNKHAAKEGQANG